MSCPRAQRPRVAVVAEFYPSRRDPVLGVWAHRQALAARDAGAEVRVLVLHRLVPPRASLAAGPAAAATRPGRAACASRAGRRATGCRSPTSPTSRRRASAPTRRGERGRRPRSALALRRLARSFPFELIHAHNAVPAGDAVRRARLEHAADRLGARRRRAVHRADATAAGAQAVARGLGAAALVLANSHGIAELARAHGAGETRVVHLGADAPAPRHGRPQRDAAGGAPPTLVTVAHLVARKRHADVLRALAVLGQRHPTLRYAIIGEGPERVALEGLAARLGVAERVDFHGQLAPDAGGRAGARAARCS